MSPTPQERALDSDFASAVLALAVLGYLLVLALLTTTTLSLDEIKLPVFAVLGSFLFAATLASLRPDERLLSGRPWLGWLAAYLLVCLVSTLASEHPWVGWMTFVTLWAGIGFFLTFALLIRTRAAFLRVVGALLLISLFEQLEAYFHYLDYPRGLMNWLYPKPPTVGTHSFYDLLLTLSGTRNLMGTILNEDFYAAYLLTVIPIAVVGVAAFRGFAMRLVSYAVALLGVAGVFITLSKDSLLGLGASALVLAALWPRGIRGADPSAKAAADRRPLWKSPPVLLVATFLLLFTLILAWLLRDRIALEVATISGAFTSRGIIYRGALRIFAKFPILGGGPGTFRIYFPYVRDMDYFLHEISNVTIYAHNHFLDLLAETGVFGFVAFVGFLLSTVRGCFVARRHSRAPGDPLALMQAGLLAAMAALAVQMCFSPVTRWVIGHLILFTLLGLIGAAAQLAPTAIADAPDSAPADADATSPRAPSMRWCRRALMGLALFGFLACSGYAMRHWKGAVAHGRGMIELEQRHYDEAADYFRKALEANPWFVTSYYKLGHALHSRATLQARNLDEVRAAAAETDAVYERLEGYWPRYAEVSYNRALIFRSLYQRALRQVTRSLATDAGGKISDEALEAHRQELEAVTALSERARDAAQFYRRQSIKFSAHEVLGDIFRDRAGFVERFGTGFGIDRDAASLYGDALEEYRLGEEAFGRQEALESVKARRSSLARLKESRLECLLKLGRWDLAVATGEELYRLDPSESELASRLVDLYLLGIGDARRALERARQFVADDPLDPRRRLDLVSAALAAGERDEALDEIATTRRLIVKLAEGDPGFNPDRYTDLLRDLEADAKALPPAAQPASPSATPESNQ